MANESSHTANASADAHPSIHSPQEEEIDPELEVIKAGEELLDALDNAFAEFDDEHFDFDFEIDSSELVSKADKLIPVKDSIPTDTQTNAINVEVQSNQDDMFSSDSVNNNDNDNDNSANGSGSMESMQETDTSNSRVSDESNTEEELEQELEKKVLEWIAKADSNDTLEQEQEEENKGCHASPLSQTPIPASLQTPLPVSSVKAIPHFVSPLAMNENIFEKCEGDSVDVIGSNLGDSKDASEQVDIVQETEEEGGHCQSTIEPLDHSEADGTNEMANQEENASETSDDTSDDDSNGENESSNDDQDKGWDFDDVDSLPSDSGDTSQVDDSTLEEQPPFEKSTSTDLLIARTSSYVCAKLDQTSDSPINTTTPSGKDHDDTKISPSPNDVASINSIPFFKAQQEAASNAEDVLNLSLEVQNLKEQINKEKDINATMKRDLEVEKEERLQVEEELKKHQKEHADAQHIYCDDIQELMAECQHAKVKIQAAEYDAQEALELAHEAAGSRTEMEVFLQHALDELELLREGVARREHLPGQQLPIIAEDDAVESDNLSYNSVDGDDSMRSPKRFSPRRLDRHRAGVSAGRTLLRQVLDQDEVSFASTLDDSVGSSTTDNSYFITLTRKSAEKRQRLVNRLKRAKSGENPSGKDVVVFSSSDRQGLDLNYTNAVSKSMKAIASVVRKSGRSLGLGGRWFKRSNRLAQPNGEEELDMETMTKSYCKSVETLITKQKDELKELKAFCDYLEDKVYAA